MLLGDVTGRNTIEWWWPGRPHARGAGGPLERLRLRSSGSLACGFVGA